MPARRVNKLVESFIFIIDFTNFGPFFSKFCSLEENHRDFTAGAFGGLGLIIIVYLLIIIINF